MLIIHILPVTTPALETLCCCLMDKSCAGRGGGGLQVSRGMKSFIKTTQKRQMLTREWSAAQKQMPHCQMQWALRVWCSLILNAAQWWKDEGEIWARRDRRETNGCDRYWKEQQWQRYDGETCLKKELSTTDGMVSGTRRKEGQSTERRIVNDTWTGCGWH